MKKKSIIISVLALAFIATYCDDSDKPTEIVQSTTALDCLPANLQTDIIAFYPFNSGSLNDASGNGQNLANPTSAAPAPDRNGNAGCAFHFDADNDEYLTFVNPTFLDNLQNGAFSIALWYNLEDDGGIYISRGNDSANCHGAGIGEWHLGGWDNNWPIFGINGYRIIGATPTEFQMNQWYHLVVTSNGTDLTMYRDGILLQEIETVSCMGTEASLNIGDLFIGFGLNGKMDDIIIYNRLLNSAEVTQLAGIAPCCG